MTNWNGLPIFSKTYRNAIGILIILLGLFFVPHTLTAQSVDDTLLINGEDPYPESQDNAQNVATQRDTVPEPRSVMFQSMIVPGWGQITNNQAWKVPIVYGLLAGVGYGTYWYNSQYQGFRAAYYNSFPEHTDQRFGPTPDFIDPNYSPQGLRQQRNYLRSRRDLSVLVFVLAYGLNIVDAYVFAHFRDFDVSDDLSANIRPGFQPLADGSLSPVISFNFNF